jgi:hypothetical protein
MSAWVSPHRETQAVMTISNGYDIGPNGPGIADAPRGCGSLPQKGGVKRQSFIATPLGLYRPAMVSLGTPAFVRAPIPRTDVD